MIRERLRSGMVTALVLAIEVGTVVVLQRLGLAKGLHIEWSEFNRWLADTAADDAIVALVRVVALAVAWWLLVSTALYLVASGLRLPGLVRGVRWVTLPGVRRLIDGVVAGSIVAGSALSAAGPVLAQTPPPVASHAYVPQPAGDAPAYTPVPAGEAPLPTTTISPVPSGPGSSTPPPSPQAQPAHGPTAGAPAGTHRVLHGDNLWTVAERHLADTTGRTIADLGHEELRAYWLRLVEANRPRLASGDPDLIYPGEVLVLPDLAER